MHVWQLQEAKAKLTQLIKEAKLEPQIISRHGVNETVVISMEKYKELVGQTEDVVSFFRRSPLNGIDLDFKRDPSAGRNIDL
jgi:prevent-host-death family protein